MPIKEGDIIEGIVTGIETYGIFLELSNSYTGLIHISEITDGFVNNITDYVILGEQIHAHVIGLDEKNNQAKLSIKNINYRINDDNVKVKESVRGFLPLHENLKIWTEEKLAEMEDSENNLP